jgi:hypothetical protein
MYFSERGSSYSQVNGGSLSDVDDGGRAAAAALASRAFQQPALCDPLRDCLAS